MLLTHIQSFAFVSTARANPAVSGDLSGAGWWIWLGTYVLADGKFLSVFSVLFGAALVLVADRSERAGVSAARVHYRRMGILFGVGLAHAYLLWWGDILVSMAVCGSLAFLYRGLAPARMLGLGIGLVVVGGILGTTLSWSSLSQDLGEISWAPAADPIGWEIGRYRGSWLDQMDHRVPAAFAYATSSLGSYGLWQLTGLMLVGGALFRLGVLSASRPTRLYLGMAIVGFGLGIPLMLWGVSDGLVHGVDEHAFRLVGRQWSFWGGLLVAAGWIGLVMLLCRRGWRPRPLAAAGRLALTNYLGQTVICTTIFYGHGLGLFGRLDRVEQLEVVAAIWVFQLVASTWWLRFFSLGPVEWAWRCLTYGRLFPVRRASLEPSAPANAGHALDRGMSLPKT